MWKKTATIWDFSFKEQNMNKEATGPNKFEHKKHLSNYKVQIIQQNDRNIILSKTSNLQKFSTLLHSMAHRVLRDDVQTTDLNGVR